MSEETITISKKEYVDLKGKANGFRLQQDFFQEIRKEIKPTKEDQTLPWYQMLAKCIKNRQFQ